MNLENLPQLPPDKANHFIYGALASVIGVALGVAFGLPLAPSAIVYAAGAGIFKEVWDRVSGKGDPSVWDALATACGGLPAMLALWLS